MPKPIEGHMINGKFIDSGGRVYDIVPAEAVILGDITTGNPGNGNGNGNGTTPKTPQPPAGPAQAIPSKEEVPQVAPPSPPETPPTPQTPAEVPQPKATAPVNSAAAYPSCISFEILKAVQTTSFAQVSVRAHCKGMYADSVIHYDFETFNQIDDSDIWVSQPGDFLKFKQSALRTAHAEAVETAKEILCKQFNRKENQDQ